MSIELNEFFRRHPDLVKLDTSGSPQEFYQRVYDTIKTSEEAADVLKDISSNIFWDMVEKTEEFFIKYPQFLQALVDKGAIQDQTALDQMVFRAIGMHDSTKLEFLLQNGGNPNANTLSPEDRFAFPLEEAVFMGECDDAVKILLDAGASIDCLYSERNKRDANFNVILAQLKAETIYALGKAGFNPNHNLIYEESILMRAACHRKPEEVQAWLDIGADPLYKFPRTGETVLDCAKESLKYAEEELEDVSSKSYEYPEAQKKVEFARKRVALIRSAQEKALTNSPVPPRNVAKNTTPAAGKGNQIDG